MKCLLILYVDFVDSSGEREEFGIEKEFDFVMRPMVGDELTICGDGSYEVTSVTYDVDDRTIEARCDRGPDLDYVQRWIDEGFRLHDMGVEVPSHLVW